MLSKKFFIGEPLERKFREDIMDPYKIPAQFLVGMTPPKYNAPINPPLVEKHLMKVAKQLADCGNIVLNAIEHLRLNNYVLAMTDLYCLFSMLAHAAAVNTKECISGLEEKTGIHAGMTDKGGLIDQETVDKWKKNSELKKVIRESRKGCRFGNQRYFN